jgi:5-methyltetrahydropteroyltriglutamate--homocysteine methyltransferase
MAAAPRIKTTVVGSYPVPDWLLALPSEQALIDATRVVIHTQEQAGIDLVCDGEFSRFDVNHPETNGMIEYFVRPMEGMRTAITFDELVTYRSQRGMGFRTRPPAVVESAIGPGALDLPQVCARGRRLASKPFKFTLTGPHMLAKSVIDTHYRNGPDLAMAIADALAAQVKHLDADVVQIDEANIPQPRRMALGCGSYESGAGCGQNHLRCASVFRQLRRSNDSKGRMGETDRLSQRPSR